jgi:GNAT superfamily N-acetyltransferase
MAAPGTATVDAIRVARADDVPVVGETLARAFHDDPVFSWMVPDPARRRRALPSLFAAFAEHFVTHEETYLADGNVGVAMWAPAGVTPIPAVDAEAFGNRVAEILGDDAARGMELSEILESHHPARPTCYLQFLGVVPPHRNRGIGGRLLAVVLARCDDTGTPSYLEATSLDNRRLYERNGYETVDEIRTTDGPSLWPMWREPRS